MDVRVERAGSAVLKLDDLDRVKRLTDAAAGAAARVQLALPGRDDPVAQPVLQRLELGRELRVDQRGDAVRLRRVDRPVEDEVGVGDVSSRPRRLVGERVVAVDPTTQLLRVEPVDGDLARPPP